DSDGNTDTDSVTLIVGSGSPPPNSPPSITNPGAQSGQTGDSVSLQIVASDPDGDALTYSATGLPDGLSIGAGGAITGTLGATGSYSVVVTASDGEDQASASFAWTVTEPPPPNTPPAVTNPGAQSGV